MATQEAATGAPPASDRLAILEEKEAARRKKHAEYKRAQYWKKKGGSPPEGDARKIKKEGPPRAQSAMRPARGAPPSSTRPREEPIVESDEEEDPYMQDEVFPAESSKAEPQGEDPQARRGSAKRTGRDAGLRRARPARAPEKETPWLRYAIGAGAVLAGIWLSSQMRGAEASVPQAPSPEPRAVGQRPPATPKEDEGPIAF